MKKKILFMLINMNVGGTEKALLNMISEMPKEEFEITVFMLEEYGGFLNLIPNHVHIKYYNKYKDIKHILNQPPHLTAINFLKDGKVIKATNILLIHLLSKILKERSIFFKYLLKGYKENEPEYDLAVAYAGPMDFISYFVINKIKAKKKIQWIHFDITKMGFNTHFASKIYKQFDKIFVVSEEGKNKLVEILPSLEVKTEKFVNVLVRENIKKMANEGEGFSDNFGGIRILTVGRLSKEKGQDLTIPVLSKLRKEGFEVRWYCIGEGNNRREYEKLISEYHVENDYILLGSKPNPYPFMKQCDIYVQPSRHEGYCITLSEARCLLKPIITTNFTGAKEQIKHGLTGIIVECNELEIYSAIKRLLCNAKMVKEFSNKLANEVDVDTMEKTKHLLNNI